jgi:RimJ/RimL family protein N-acetyltransferase
MVAMLYTDHLETPRLTTRFLTPEDVPAWMEYCSDPIATKYTALPGKTPEEMAQAWIDFALKRYRDNSFGLQALISKETCELVGQCGLLVQIVNRQVEIEVGYHLLRRHWGKGYATEAAAMFVDYGFEQDFADSIVSLIHPQNMPSMKVAERLGMTLTVKNIMLKDYKENIFRVTRKEWEGVGVKMKPLLGRRKLHK